MAEEKKVAEAKAEEKAEKEIKAEVKVEAKTQEAPKAKAPEAKKEKPEAKKEASGEDKKPSKSTVEISDATPAQVVKVFRKVGLYGECYQVLARVLEGRDKGNLLRRNVRGPVKENDLLMLKESERDARAV